MLNGVNPELVVRHQSKRLLWQRQYRKQRMYPLIKIYFIRLVMGNIAVSMSKL